VGDGVFVGLADLVGVSVGSVASGSSSVPHHLVRRRVGALQEVLTVQQGAVEPALRKPHAAIIGQ